jgi:hypothetical protein
MNTVLNEMPKTLLSLALFGLGEFYKFLSKNLHPDFLPVSTPSFFV